MYTSGRSLKLIFTVMSKGLSSLWSKGLAFQLLRTATRPLTKIDTNLKANELMVSVIVCSKGHINEIVEGRNQVTKNRRLNLEGLAVPG